MRCENEAQRITKSGASARWALAGQPGEVGRRVVAMSGIASPEQAALCRWFCNRRLQVGEFGSVR